MLSSARCDRCEHALPLRAPWLDFRLPPRAVTCPGCGTLCDTILPYRVGWMEALVLKIELLLLPFLLVWFAIHHPPALHLVGAVLGGLLSAFVLSRVIAFPLTLLLDRARRS